MIWKRLFAGGENSLKTSMSDGTDPESDGVDAQLEAALDWLDDTTAKLQNRGIGRFQNWKADIEAGRINFSNETGESLNFACEVVGTFNREKRTWHWAWDHPSIPLGSARASVAVRDFGQRNALGAFTTRQIQATEEDAWQFVALGGMLTEAAGAYRSPGTVEVYLTLYELT